MFGALRDDLEQFLERVQDHTNEITYPELPLERSLLELFYVYLLLPLIVDILRTIRDNLEEYEDVVSSAMNARYLELSRWDSLIAFFWV